MGGVGPDMTSNVKCNLEVDMGQGAGMEGLKLTEIANASCLGRL